jgi:diacylglycerol kinase family enzyme
MIAAMPGADPRRRPTSNTETPVLSHPGPNPAQRPTNPPRRPVLFVNPRSGGGRAARAGLAERARERGITAIVLHPEDDLGTLVADCVARGADALGIAGGDGSLAVVAAAAVVHELPFICIPAGTRNHFALDLGLDRRDLTRSLDAFTEGAVERRIDTGEVNGRLFVNNVSLGIYGEAVRHSTYRDAKARTLLETAVQVLGPSASALNLQVVDERGRPHLNPAVVLVSNNPYSFEPPHARGARPRLDTGLLGIIVLDNPHAGPGSALTWTAARFEATAPTPVHAGVDGEAVALTPPLAFAVRPRALRVRIASSHPGVS